MPRHATAHLSFLVHAQRFFVRGVTGGRAAAAGGTSSMLALYGLGFYVRALARDKPPAASPLLPPHMPRPFSPASSASLPACLSCRSPHACISPSTAWTYRIAASV